jgi:hypothetical protein
MKWSVIASVVMLAACGHPRPSQNGVDASGGGGDATGGGHDAAGDAKGGGHDAAADATGGGHDAAGGHDAGVDAGGAHDAAHADAASGIITGGLCISGAGGATAYRVRWANSGGTAYPVYEVNGLPDHSRDHTAAYGYQIGFTAAFVDPYLGDGGVQLDDSDFIDIELSTAGVSAISTATLSIYGRSYNTTASGSFNWQTFDGVGSTPDNFVSNVAPYQWYSADMTTEISPGDDRVLLRIKAGPNSDSLVVNRIELCFVAQ